MLSRAVFSALWAPVSAPAVQRAAMSSSIVHGHSGRSVPADADLKAARGGGEPQVTMAGAAQRPQRPQQHMRRQLWRPSLHNSHNAPLALLCVHPGSSMAQVASLQPTATARHVTLCTATPARQCQQMQTSRQHRRASRRCGRQQTGPALAPWDSRLLCWGSSAAGRLCQNLSHCTCRKFTLQCCCVPLPAAAQFVGSGAPLNVNTITTVDDDDGQSGEV